MPTLLNFSLLVHNQKYFVSIVGNSYNFKKLNKHLTVQVTVEDLNERI